MSHDWDKLTAAGDSISTLAPVDLVSVLERWQVPRGGSSPADKTAELVAWKVRVRWFVHRGLLCVFYILYLF